MIRRNSGENVDAWKKYEHAREVLGAEELLTAFATAMNDQNMLEEIIGYIYQDFAEELSESRRPRGRMLREERGCSRRRMMKESPVDYAPGADGKPIGNGEYWFKITTPYSGGASDTNIYKGYLDVTLSDDKVLYQAEMEPKNGDVIVGNDSVIEAYRDEDCKTFACDFHVRSWALKYKKPVGASRDKNRNIVNVYMGRGPKPQKHGRR